MKENPMVYYAQFEPAEEGGFVITFPHPEGATQGENEADGMEMAADFLLCAMSIHIRNGDPLRDPKVYKGKRYRPVHLPALAAIKVELYRAFQASGVRKAELARRMGIPKTNVDRLFDVKFKTSLTLMEAAFPAIGKRLEVAVHDRAA